MPKATVSQDTIKEELKSCPGGYVVLKKLPYGKKLARREQATRMSMESQLGKGRRDDDVQKLDLQMMQRWAAQYDFAECIVDHNLEDDNGKKLDFSNNMTLDVLDPLIGEEIERLINDLNGDLVSEDDLETFTRSVSESSPKEPTGLREVTPEEK